jgi:hydrophobe/amphiphile efflux-3 (HAE3) family protein
VVVERLVAFVLARPRLVIACVAVVTAFFAFELRGLRPRVDLRDLMPRGHPYMGIDERLREEFGAGLTAVIAIGARTGDVYDAEILAKVARLTEGVAAVPGVVPESVMSLTSPNVKALRPEDGAVRVAPLVEGLPASPAELAALRETVAAHPMYVGTLVTRDGRGALVLADFAEEAPVEETTEALEALAARERDARTELFVGGQSAALAAVQKATRRIFPLLALALVVIALVHYEAFRTAQAVVLPLATAILSVVWSMGLTSLFGVRLTPWTALTAILVLSVAAGHAVQILKRYYECYAELGQTRAAVAASLVRIGPVMIAAGSVAAAGFASLASFGVPAVRDFGLMAAAGIASALVLELTFIPAVRALLPAPRIGEAARERDHRFLGPALDGIAERVVARPGAVLLGALAAVGAVAIGVARLEVNTSFRSWFGRDEPVMVAERAIRERFTGTSTIRVRVEADADQGVVAPRTLRGIAELERAFSDEPDVTATLSVADYLKVMHRAMSGETAPDALPEDPDLIAQYLLLYGPTDLERVLTADGRAAAIHALARSDDVEWVDGVFARLREVGARAFPPGVRVEVAGGELAQASANNETVVREKLENMLQVSAVIFALSSLVFRSLAAGLLVLAPLACAVLANLGAMGWLGSWLSFATATYTSMGVSLGADFAIYLLFRLREEMRSQPMEGALRETFRTSGRAIFFVASAIAAGYATLLVSGFALWRQLGGYVALMMAASALATLTVLPALVLLTRPRFLGGKRVPRVDA